jgi:hypothetical protein
VAVTSFSALMSVPMSASVSGKVFFRFVYRGCTVHEEVKNKPKIIKKTQKGNTMKKKSLLTKLFAIFMVGGLIMLNIQISKPPHSSLDDMSVSISVNKAMAYMQENLEMTQQACWNTGEQINICRYANSTCDVGAQDPC